jgi:hypothetical protein
MNRNIFFLLLALSSYGAILPCYADELTDAVQKSLEGLNKALQQISESQKNEKEKEQEQEKKIQDLEQKLRELNEKEKNNSSTPQTAAIETQTDPVTVITPEEETDRNTALAQTEKEKISYQEEREDFAKKITDTTDFDSAESILNKYKTKPHFSGIAQALQPKVKSLNASVKSLREQEETDKARIKSLIKEVKKRTKKKEEAPTSPEDLIPEGSLDAWIQEQEEARLKDAKEEAAKKALEEFFLNKSAALKLVKEDMFKQEDALKDALKQRKEEKHKKKEEEARLAREEQDRKQEEAARLKEEEEKAAEAAVDQKQSVKAKEGTQNDADVSTTETESGSEVQDKKKNLNQKSQDPAPQQPNQATTQQDLNPPNQTTTQQDLNPPNQTTTQQDLNPPNQATTQQDLNPLNQTTTQQESNPPNQTP